MHPLRSLIVAVLLVSLAPHSVAAAETGAIEGRVINESTGAPEPGVRVVLSIGAPGGSDVETLERTTDDRGRYSFRDLATGQDQIYAIDAFFQGGMFSGGALALPSDTQEPPVITSKLRVWNTTTDPAALLIKRDDIFLSANDDGGVGAIESVTIANTSSEAYVGRGADDAGAQPGRTATVGFSLPPEATNTGVSIVDADIDVPALLSTEYGFAITAALPPGETRFTFSYPIEGLTGSYDISRRALYPILELEVFAAAPLEIESNRLQPNGQAEVGGRTYERFSTTDPLEAGDSIQVIAVAEAGTPAGLIAGMAGVLALVLLLGTIPFIRSRKRRTEPAPTRDELIRAIAALDIEHEGSDLPTEEWAARRAELKAELASLDDKQPAQR